MKKLFAIFKRIKIRKKHKEATQEHDFAEVQSMEAAESDRAEKDTSEETEPAKQSAEGGKPEKKGKKRKFPAPPKVAGFKIPFKGKRKILLIVLAIVLAAGAGAGFAMMKLGLIGSSSGEHKSESAKTEHSADKEEAGAEGEHSSSESKASEPQIAKITVTAIDIDLGVLEGHLASNYIKILRTKNYTIRYRTTTVYNGQSYEAETTYAVYGDNIALSSGDRSTVILNQNVYILDHTNRTMISWRATQTENLRTIDTSDMVFEGSSESGGLICEEYTTATARIKFYFRDAALVEIVTVINNQDESMDILEFKEGVPMELFNVPGDYQNTNITDTINDGQRP